MLRSIYDISCLSFNFEGFLSSDESQDDMYVSVLAMGSLSQK